MSAVDEFEGFLNVPIAEIARASFDVADILYFLFCFVDRYQIAWDLYLTPFVDDFVVDVEFWVFIFFEGCVVLVHDVLKNLLDFAQTFASIFNVLDVEVMVFEDAIYSPSDLLVVMI